MIKKLFILSTTILFVTLLGVFIYGWHLAGKVEDRFSSRRWSIPSKVFTDTMLLYPGQRLNRGLFQKKLKRMGYREVPGRPTRRGEKQTAQNGLRLLLFLNDLKTPWENRPGFPVKIEFKENIIDSIVRQDDGTSLPLLEIEPEEIMLFFGLERERRQLVSFKQIPQHVIHAVLAAEDNRFFEHYGVDPRGILRALLTNLRHGSIRQGGSTITQQLAKNYFLTPDRKLTRKFQEIVLAFTMEWKYSKEDILEIYLNEIYLGQKGSVAINGIGEAAYFYFGKPVQELSLSEAATIAGLIKAPNNYSPYADKNSCRTRRNLILKAMQRKGWISDEVLQAQIKTPIEPAGYNVTGKKAPYYIDYLTQQLGMLYKPEDLATLGLSIYTTLDSQVQMAADKALTKGLRRLENKNPSLKRKSSDRSLQGAVVVMQPKTGQILAMVGGRNYNASQFNRVTQARRQPGSAFKPFVYLTGLDKFTPISILSNQPKTYFVDGAAWEPNNFESAAKEQVTVRKALENSYNLATVDLAMQIGLEPVIDNATRFGFTTSFEPYPSLALGAFEVIPLELARAYCVFAAEGVMTFPLALKAVSDENGHVLEQRHLKIERLISAAKAFILNSLLQGVIDNGTGRSLRNRGINWPVAGKTGTTNNYRDAWFIGYTPDILALVWVGFDNGDPIKATGAEAALPIWAELMNAIPHHISKSNFRVPDGIVKRFVCIDEGNAFISKNCPQPYEEYFLAQNAPQESIQRDGQPGILDQLIKGIKDLFQQ
ncbi:MAG: PBP1A family penicillin-binding protein [Deltaproteobacteria bacterium]|nr:PBP1A family penicillin-binding protein [Deltaproteobacteria bacterium]